MVHDVGVVAQAQAQSISAAANRESDHTIDGMRGNNIPLSCPSDNASPETGMQHTQTSCVGTRTSDGLAR